MIYQNSQLAYSQEELVDRLISIAKKSMEENRYFLVTLIGSGFQHAVTGMGITDGSWTFNDINYDKCVLTLDSNGVDSDLYKNGIIEVQPFKSGGCIFINSETKQFYVPAYEKYNINSENERCIIGSYDNDTFLIIRVQSIQLSK